VTNNETASYLRYLRIKIKDAEAEMEYLGRCFSALDKPDLTDKETKEKQRIHRRIRQVNRELMGLWHQEEIEEIVVDMEKAHSAGRPYFPIVEGKPPDPQ
jgi:hypothetical protein